MKTFIFSYQTAYGLGITIIMAYTEEEAKVIAENDRYVWQPYTITCIEDMPRKIGVCFQEHS